MAKAVVVITGGGGILGEGDQVTLRLNGTTMALAAGNAVGALVSMYGAEWTRELAPLREVLRRIAADAPELDTRTYGEGDHAAEDFEALRAELAKRVAQSVQAQAERDTARAELDRFRSDANRLRDLQGAAVREAEALRKRLAEREAERDALPDAVSRARAEDGKCPLWQCVGCRDTIIGIAGEDDDAYVTRDAHAKRCNARLVGTAAFDLAALWVTS